MAGRIFPAGKAPKIKVKLIQQRGHGSLQPATVHGGKSRAAAGFPAAHWQRYISRDPAAGQSGTWSWPCRWRRRRCHGRRRAARGDRIPLPRETAQQVKLILDRARVPILKLCLDRGGGARESLQPLRQRQAKRARDFLRIEQRLAQTLHQWDEVADIAALLIV